MRQAVSLTMLVFFFVFMTGCAAEVTLSLQENGFPASPIILAQGIDVRVENETGGVVYDQHLDQSSDDSLSVRLKPGDYVATATSPNHQPAKASFHIGPLGKPQYIDLSFPEVMIRGRVTYHGDSPPEAWRGDVSVELWGYDDFDCHNPTRLATTVVDSQGYYVFVAPVEQYVNPIAYVTVGSTCYIKPGFVCLYGKSQDLVWRLDYTFDY